MLISSLCGLLVAVIYAWLFSWYLGYHGVFLLFIYILWIVFYNNCWELYICWISQCICYGEIFNWIELGNGLIITIGYVTNLMSLGVTIVMVGGSLIVIIFVYNEMWDDKEGIAFVILLILFLIFMEILLISDNLLVFYLGWEGIGLVSLFLISFWTTRVRSIKATFKVFCLNKLGDCLLLWLICLIIGKCGNVNFEFLESWALILSQKLCYLGGCTFELCNVIAITAVLAGGVKSVQFGFHIWLVEAMEAPLGASALMHSSTLVIAGIVLIYKLYAIINLSWPATLLLIVWGSWTTLFAAFIACWQFEVKGILAYSTISSMGSLYVLLGCGTIDEMLLFLLIHALIKIFLFLLIGSILTHCGGIQDLRWMGGLMQYMPYGCIFYSWGIISLVGFPYWSGYFCKSQMWIALNNTFLVVHGSQLCFILGSVCTCIYLLRILILIFHGCKRGHKSIYRTTAPSGFLIIIITILLFAMLYYSLVWNQIIYGWAQSINFYWLDFYGNKCEKVITWFGWHLFGILYIISNIILVWLLFIWCNTHHNNLNKLWKILKWSWLIIYIWFCIEYPWNIES